MKCKTWKFSTYASTKQKQKNKKAHFHNKGNKYFYHAQSVLEPFGNPSFLSPPCPMATTDGLSVAVDQLKFSVNWNMSICLVFFTEHNDFEVHSYYCMYQYSIPFLLLISIPVGKHFIPSHFARLMSSFWWLALMCKAAMNTHSCMEYIFFKFFWVNT